MDDNKRFLILDIDGLYEVARISEQELITILLLREDEKLIEKIVFRDRQKD